VSARAGTRFALMAIATMLAAPMALAQSGGGAPSGSTAVPPAPTGAVARYEVVGDAIPVPLTATPGDAARGRAIVADRQVGLCLLCHRGPFPEERFQGTLATDLSGAGARWSEGQLRLRVVDSRRLNPDSLMPAYHRVDGLTGVAAAHRGKPVLDAQQVEDVVALLRTLR
jgi:sulfur-oxidizing protein SoxX